MFDHMENISKLIYFRSVEKWNYFVIDPSYIYIVLGSDDLYVICSIAGVRKESSSFKCLNFVAETL
jgi:hypothetical protein